MEEEAATESERVAPSLGCNVPVEPPRPVCFCVCMSRRINVVLSDEVHRQLIREVTRGERSRVLEEALRQYLRARNRTAAFQRLEALRERGPVVSMRAVVAQLRRDRGRA